MNTNYEEEATSCRVQYSFSFSFLGHCPHLLYCRRPCPTCVQNAFPIHFVMLSATDTLAFLHSASPLTSGVGIWLPFHFFRVSNSTLTFSVSGPMSPSDWWHHKSPSHSFSVLTCFKICLFSSVETRKHTSVIPSPLCFSCFLPVHSQVLPRIDVASAGPLSSLPSCSLYLQSSWNLSFIQLHIHWRTRLCARMVPIPSLWWLLTRLIWVLDIHARLPLVTLTPVFIYFSLNIFYLSWLNSVLWVRGTPPFLKSLPLSIIFQLNHYLPGRLNFLLS